MKKVFFISLLISVAIGQGLMSQNSLSGIVLDENDKSIFFATAVLYNQSDSSIAKSASTGENGNFNIQGINSGRYYLEIRFLGYENYIKQGLEFPKNNNLSVLVKMEMSKNELGEVVVEGKKPLLEQEPDRLIVNVSDNIAGNNNTMLDVMKNVPGVVVAGDKISLAGSTNLTILINGKTTKYMDMSSLLKDMPGDNIEKVEVIHQPGAEFDAAGSGPIINVVLKKNSLFGTFGSVNSGFSKGDTWRYKTGASFTHYQGSVNISGSVGYQNSDYNSLMDLDRYTGTDFHDQTSRNEQSFQSYKGDLNIEWDINNRHKVGIQSRFINYDLDNLVKTDLDIIHPNNSIESSFTRNDRDAFWQLGSVNPYYTFEIDSLGQKLEFDFNYIQFGSKDESNMVERDIDNNVVMNQNRTNQPGDTKITVAKLDYTYPFSKYLKLQIGSKYSFADLDNDYQAEVLQQNNVWERSNQSNHYLFNETIIAGYGKLSFNKDKWSGTMGLRYEDSKSNGKSIGLDTVLTRDIANFFPSASISREIIKNLKGIIAYSYRLERPDYASLNPFRNSLDAHTFEVGNPDLRAEYTHSMKFSLAYQNQPFFNVEYKKTSDPITQTYEQNDETGEASRSHDNLDIKNEFGVSLFFPLDFIPKVSGYGGMMVNNKFFDTKYLDDTYELSKWDMTAFLQMNIKLPWKILAELSGYYTSGGLEGVMRYDYMYGASAGVSRKFLDNRLKVNMGVDNFVGRFFYGNLEYSNLNLKIYNEWEAPVLNFQVSYSFGNKHLTKKKHTSSADEELNRTGKN